MRGPAFALVGCMVLTGCGARTPPPAPPVALLPPPEVSLELVRSQVALARADDEFARGNYRAALGIYDHFLELAPDDEAVTQARATRVLIDRFLSAQAAARRLEGDVDHLDDEITELKRELAGSRKEAARLRADVEHLKDVAADLERLKLIKADLERLKDSDLRLERRVR